MSNVVRHMSQTPHDDYAINSADCFGVITATGSIRPIRYDLKQVNEEGFIRYNASLHGEWRGYVTDHVPTGLRISIVLAEDVRDQLVAEVQGWVVPDHQLGMFLRHMDEPVYRMRDDDIGSP